VGNGFYRPYSRRGVVCNYEFHSSYDDMKAKGWGTRETFEKGLSDPISYLHLNLVDYSRLQSPPAELREAVTDAARRIGFRFVLDRASRNDVIRMDGKRPGRLVLEQTWRNAGVAPCYDSYALRWSLVSNDGKVAAQTVTFPRRPTTLWWPGEEVAVHDLMLIPPDTPPGLYRLKLEMVKPEEPGVRIQLGIGGLDVAGRYDLGEVRAQRVDRSPESAYEETFESGTGDWSAADGMSAQAERDPETGGGILIVSGKEPGKAWSYASARVGILPYSRYRLSCWMRVDAIAPHQAPYLKLGVNGADGKWITNANSNNYDLQKVGVWQRLVVDAETPPSAASGDIALEKGALETPISATIRIRDVRLELLETP
jgi:hypothetical protein